MLERILQYLENRPEGAAPEDLLSFVFVQTGGGSLVGRQVLRAMLGEDHRFRWDEKTERWHLRADSVPRASVEDEEFVVVDLETTGSGRRADGIIEIAAARLRDGKLEAEFSQLVRPSVPLPPFITSLTGISPEMLEDQPSLPEVWPEFRQFVGSRVLVAHNASYDLAYLNDAALRLDGKVLPNQVLCTLRLARRLLPDQRRRGLDALAGLFGVPVLDRHRALGDVRMTVEVFFHLRDRVREAGVKDVAGLLALQHLARDGRPFESPLPRDKVRQLPDAPGIYRFLGEDGGILYIGRARNLRQRVSSYLRNSRAHSGKTLDLIRLTHDVRVSVCATELEAALEEAAAIRREKPAYNRLGRHLPRVAFLRLGSRDPFPRIQITSRPGRGRSRWLGPWKDRDEAERVLRLVLRHFRLRTCSGRLRPDPGFAPCLQGQIGECTAPCTGSVSPAEYARQVTACLASLSGTGAEFEERLASRRDEYSAEQRYEAAASLQREIQFLLQLRERRRRMEGVDPGGSYLLLQRALQGGGVVVYGVVDGQLVVRTTLQAERQWYPFLEELAGHFGPGRSRDTPQGVEGSVILAAWLRDRGRGEGHLFPLEPPGLQKKWPATRESEWRAALRELLLESVELTVP